MWKDSPERLTVHYLDLLSKVSLAPTNFARVFWNFNLRAYVINSEAECVFGGSVLQRVISQTV